MPDQIEITDLRLTPVEAHRMNSAEGHQMTPVTAQPGMAWFDLVVTVKNVSESATQYVITDVCRMHYDAARRVLYIDFSEHALPESTSDLGLPSPSRYTAIAPVRRPRSPLGYLRKSRS